MYSMEPSSGSGIQLEGTFFKFFARRKILVYFLIPLSAKRKNLYLSVSAGRYIAAALLFS